VKVFFLFITFLIPVVCVAQEGHITVVQDTSIQHVLNLYQTFAKEKRQVNGYRIQLASNNSRQQLLDLKAKFIQQYPKRTAYVEYSAPQFKLRVGDFKTHGEADMFLTEVKVYFSSAFIVPDKIVIEGVEW
jgi:hypothetical protein